MNPQIYSLPYEPNSTQLSSRWNQSMKLYQSGSRHLNCILSDEEGRALYQIHSPGFLIKRTSILLRISSDSALRYNAEIASGRDEREDWDLGTEEFARIHWHIFRSSRIIFNGVILELKDFMPRNGKLALWVPSKCISIFQHCELCLIFIEREHSADRMAVRTLGASYLLQFALCVPPYSVFHFKARHVWHVEYCLPRTLEAHFERWIRSCQDCGSFASTRVNRRMERVPWNISWGTAYGRAYCSYLAVCWRDME